MKLLLARLRAIHGALPFWQRVTTERARDALAAAFLHDVGHGPLSHLFEDAIPGTPHHETWTERIVLDPSTGVHQVLAALDPRCPRASRRSSTASHELAVPRQGGERRVRRRPLRLPPPRRARDRRPLRALRSRLAPPQPALRARRRDASGAPALAIDGAKGLPAIEAFIIARLFMFQQVYLHKATRAAEWMIRTILARAVERAARRRAPRRRCPRAIERRRRAASRSPLGDYLELDDGVLCGRDARLGGVARSGRWPTSRERIRARALFKTLELFGEQALAAGREEALARRARGRRRRAGFDPDVLRGARRRERHPVRRRGGAAAASSTRRGRRARSARSRSCSGGSRGRSSRACASSSRPSCATTCSRALGM